MNRRTANTGPARSGAADLLGALVAILVAVAAVVIVGSSLDATLKQWWWVVAAVGVGAGLLEVLVLNRPGPAAPHVQVGVAEGSRVAESAFVDPVSSFASAAVPGGAPTVPGAAATRFAGEPMIVGFTGGVPVLDDSPTMPAQPVTTAAMTVAGAPGVVRRATGHDAGVWRSDVLWTPKSSHGLADHEDAWAIDDATGRAALADGASSAFMARQWAMAITSRFLDDPPPPGHGGFARWVEGATEQWGSNAAGGEASASWWAAASEERGSYATLIGLALEPSDGIEDVVGFTTIAVGDSCLVHLTPDGDVPERNAWKQTLAFPLERPEEFGKHPELVATTGARADGSMPVQRSAAGQLRRGDALLLLSDAVAQFALEVDTNGDRSIWSWLLRVDQEEFTTVITKARAHDQIEDDDSTVVRILI